MSSGSEKQTIIVDEDWKAQVHAEKEAEKSGSSSAAPGSAGGSSAAPESPPDHEMPPASLTFLCTTIATQAMIALGQVPNPITGKVEQRIKQAKHYIDTLAVLGTVTKGPPSIGATEVKPTSGMSLGLPSRGNSFRNGK